MLQYNNRSDIPSISLFGEKVFKDVEVINIYSVLLNFSNQLNVNYNDEFFRKYFGIQKIQNVWTT